MERCPLSDRLGVPEAVYSSWKRIGEFGFVYNGFDCLEQGSERASAANADTARSAISRPNRFTQY